MPRNRNPRINVVPLWGLLARVLGFDGFNPESVAVFGRLLSVRGKGTRDIPPA